MPFTLFYHTELASDYIKNFSVEVRRTQQIILTARSLCNADVGDLSLHQQALQEETRDHIPTHQTRQYACFGFVSQYVLLNPTQVA